MINKVFVVTDHSRGLLHLWSRAAWAWDTSRSDGERAPSLTSSPRISVMSLSPLSPRLLSTDL